MFLLLSFVYIALLFFLAWRNFKLALSVFIISLPTYLIRLQIGPLPTTLLELEFGVLFLVWLIKFFRNDWQELKQFFSPHSFFRAGLVVFFLASIAGILISDQWYISLGQWRAYFLEPILFFLMLIGRRSAVASRSLALALTLSSISISIVAIIQVATGTLYPPSLWDDIVGGRATAFFTSPNAVGLFLAPIFIITLGLWYETRQNNGNRHKRRFLLGLLFLIGLGLLSSQSLGALLATFIGILFFGYRAGYKKPALVALALGLVIILLPTTRHLLAIKSKSFASRLVLWQHTREFLTKSPTNFVLGAGIRQYFRKVEKPHYNPKELERLIYPHNILLNFWSEIGLFGVLAFLCLLGELLRAAYRAMQSNDFFAIGLFTTLIVFAIHGLIDVPYFKNDLAFLFWIIAAIIMNLKIKKT